MILVEGIGLRARRGSLAFPVRPGHPKSNEPATKCGLLATATLPNGQGFPRIYQSYLIYLSTYLSVHHLFSFGPEGGERPCNCAGLANFRNAFDQGFCVLRRLSRRTCTHTPRLTCFTSTSLPPQAPPNTTTKRPAGPYRRCLGESTRLLRLDSRRGYKSMAGPRRARLDVDQMRRVGSSMAPLFGVWFKTRTDAP